MQSCFRVYDADKQTNTEAGLIAVHALSVLAVIFMLEEFNDNVRPMAMLICALLSVILHAWRNKGGKNVILVGLLCVTVIYIIFFRSWFFAGIYQFSNNGIALYNYNYGKEILYYSLPESVDTDTALNVFLCYLVILLGVMIRYILEAGQITVFVLCSFFEILPGLVFKYDAAGIICIFAGMAVVGALMWINSGKQVGRRLTVYMYVFLVLGLIISGLYYKVGNYTSNLTVDKMRQSAMAGAQGVIYGEQDSPQGDLSKAASFVGDGSSKLTVTVSKQGVYYLKGYVGGIYKDGVWNEIDRSNYGDSYEGLFHWLNEKHFNPLSQNSEYIQIARNMDGFDSERVMMEVENLSANRRYIYYPYGLTTDALSDFSKTNRDMNIYSADRNEVNYSFEFDDYDIAKAFAYENPEWLNSSGSDKNIEDFREAQVEYMTFVYDNYLEIDPSFKKYFDSVLDKSSVNGYVTITNSIRKWLEDKTLINNGVNTDDYLMYFLTKIREGNSSFYASAGTLMYRYYGIPARYVEGYLADITESMEGGIGENSIIYDNDKNGNTIYKKSLSGANVHAWVEIYRDGIGWIPVDVTPGFYSELEVTKQVQMKTEELEKEQQKQEQNEEKEQKRHKVHVVFVLKYILYIVVMILIAMIFLLTLRSRIICHRRNKILHGVNDERAIHHWSGFVRQLLLFVNLNESDISGEIIEVLQRYRFRDETITDDDYRKMVDYAYDMQKDIYEKEGKRRRLKMKYVLALI